MICSSEKRFFTSNLLGIGNWTPNRCATQTRGDVGGSEAARSAKWRCMADSAASAVDVMAGAA
ncbi:hypothetical protein EYC54_17700 [Xanthomonas oryzae]|nr:hypothetical protein EYC54_17700 [Xanthomonas oryzae]